MIFRKLMVAGCLLWLTGTSFAGDASAPVGLGQGVQPLSMVQELTLPTVDREALLAEDHMREVQGLPPRFAVPNFVSLTPQTAGTWDDLADGDRLWRLRVHGQNALSLNFGFGEYHLPAGARLFIYTPDGSQLLGPYTDEKNRSHGQLWTPPVPGEEAVIELRIQAKMLPFLKLELIAINYGYREMGLPGALKSDAVKAVDALKSGACNIDVACPQADPWLNEIRSAARISIEGRFLCSGFLVNNTRGDITPYFMTADHCGITTGNAQTVVVYWNYETSTCGGPPNGSLAQFQSGAFFRAGWSLSQGSDFTLIELDEPPNPSFQVRWTGWDRSAGNPASAVAIHHPNGDEKRISFDSGPLTTASWPPANPPVPGSHLRVAAWDQGVTEPGSSGSGLWNQNRRIVGHLTGGSSACTNPGGSDYFGRFSLSWEGGGSAFNRLRDRLDPDNTGAVTLDGRDGCIPPSVDFSATPNPALINEPVTFTASVSGGVPPYTYAWDMNGDGTIDCATAGCTHTYPAPYNGNVKLTVTDSQSCQRSVSHAVAANSPFSRVTLLAPNGGESIPAGILYTIRWGAQDSAVTFKLHYKLRKRLTWKTIAAGISGNSYDWPVPVPKGNKMAAVRVIGYDAAGTRVGSDRSDALFTIQVLRLTTPIEGSP